MKRTLTINISGTVFHIDDDAYEKLKSYLSKLTSHYNNEEGGHEIISDIEARISELFFVKTNNNQSVVNLSMVNEIIETMGLPDDFNDVEESYQQETPNYNYTPQYKKSKRLYRDPDSKVIGGVCSGLSYYLNLDKTLTRILFIVLAIVTSGVAVPAYLILWIAVPKARTISQKLEMKGEKVNVDNIGNAVKEEYNESKDNYTHQYADNSQQYDKESGNVLVKILGAILLFIGFISLAGITTALLATSSIIGFVPEFLPGAHNGILLDHIFSGGMATTLLISTFIIVGIPFLLVIYAGSKMLFNFTSNSRAIILSSLGIWIIGIILAITTSVGAADIFSSNASTSETKEITTTSDTLYISIDPTNFEEFDRVHFEVNNTKLITQNDKEQIIARPEFTIEPTSLEVPELRIKKLSKGNNYKTAKSNAEDIRYKYKLEGNKLLLDPYFIINNKWRSQQVKARLKLPEGKVVFLHNNLLPIIYDIKNTSNTWDGDMVNEYWEMKTEGLTLVK